MLRRQCWVESLDGPLIVVPVFAIAGWPGSHRDRDDCDRACTVDGLAAIP
jgi:hypothetical protein